ncbi:hypothetical protein HMPREF3197_02429 [Klebsiella pneumoniae]|nr:hypothetical protein HMPREF3197_02429 [Klebsiella pneumoniae]
MSAHGSRQYCRHALKDSADRVTRRSRPRHDKISHALKRF